MAKKGDIARENVKNTIIEAFESKGLYVCTKDKKIYVNSVEGDEVLQFAISITMPKTAIEAGAQTTRTSETKVGLTNSATATVLSDEDSKKVEELKQKLKDAGVYQE